MTEKILLNDILNIPQDEIPNTRVKFNIHNGYSDPLELYKANPEEVNTKWFLWHDSRRYFRRGQLAICFLRISADTWLLTTVKRIIKEIDIENGVGYEAEEVEAYKKYFGRILVKYHNTYKSMGRTFESLKDDLEVLEILNDQFQGDDFPGYENVRLSYFQLKTIIDRHSPGWIAALQNQKAVYLITDTKTGKLYVGSATAQEGMLLQRWSEYIANGHGRNEGLKEIVRDFGFDYVKNHFQYSILENYNARMDDQYIINRENWWKNTLKSREFGMNKN